MARCYLCGKTAEKLTRDHIPPASFFVKPKPSNLITVDCCFECNNGLTKVDELFRLFAVSSIVTSATGKAVWHNRILKSTIPSRRIAKEIREMISTIEKGFIATPFGPVLADRLAMKAAVVDRFLIRLTKGLLTKFYPELDYSDFRFEITMFDQLKLLQTLESISVLFVKDQRGGDTFRFWRGLAADKPTYGVWIYSFYEGVTFMVSHDVPG